MRKKIIKKVTITVSETSTSGTTTMSVRIEKWPNCSEKVQAIELLELVNQAGSLIIENLQRTERHGTLR